MTTNRTPIQRPAVTMISARAIDLFTTMELQHYLGHRNIQHTVRYTTARSGRARVGGHPM